MLSYLWLVSSTVMVEIRVELLITLILQFKFPWPSSTYWGWLSIRHRSKWKNYETRDQTKNKKQKQQSILKDLSVISFFDFITTCSTLTSTCIYTEHIHLYIPEVSNCMNGILYVCLQVGLQSQTNNIYIYAQCPIHSSERKQVGPIYLSYFIIH